jgi:SAM-dependent methyltransferase
MALELKKPLSGDRSFEQLRNHYEVERAIASKLKESGREERKIIYRTMYDELFQKVPDHPRLTAREDETITSSANRSKLGLLERFMDRSKVFVEFAPGDCRFAAEVCKYFKFVQGIDISDQRGSIESVPDNFELIVYDGYNLPLKKNSVDVVFSDQLIEHLHPEDTVLHFRLVRNILKKGGVYVFRTPHRFSGPHDISGYFSDEPEGFHLKEWTYSELARLLNQVNYSSWYGIYGAKGIHIRMPVTYFSSVEKMLAILPGLYRKRACRYLCPGISMVAIK